MAQEAKTIRTETLIIGAGPTGLACAMELSKRDKDFVIVERDIAVGGLAKTYTFRESDGSVFYTDNGPHRFFSKNPYLYEFIGELLGEDWITVRRQTRQYIDGKYFDYPVNAIQALRNIGFFKAARMLVDYVVAKITYGIFRKPVRNFEDYVVANFGRTLGEFNMINYTEKIWGIPAAEIHPDWARQRIKGLDLREVIRDVFRRLTGKKGGKAKSLVDTFYYPREGTGQIYEKIKTVLEQKGYRIFLNTKPISIRKKDGKFYVSVVDGRGEEMDIVATHLVESIPITEFITLLGREVPKAIATSVAALRHRSQVYLFVTLDKPSITADQWIYLPLKNVPIGRVSEMRNFSDYMSPPGKTSLFIEFFCFEGDDIWNLDKQELFELALSHCQRAGFFVREEVRNFYRIEKKNVYPVYDLSYQTYLGEVKKYLDGIKNLYYIGRPGRFRYNNQDHSLEMGIMAAKSIIDGVRYDIEGVGEEKEYFESGKVFEKK